MNSSTHAPQSKSAGSLDKITIFGSADIDQQHPLYKTVYDVAQYLASQGKTVINGGGPGTMLAATEGAKSAGGRTITVTFFPEDMPEFEGKDVKNVPDQEIRTTTYIERMFGLIHEADAYVCFQGGTGTLSEWATAWLLAHLHYGKHKPLILYGAFWKDFMRAVNEHFFIGEAENNVYQIVENQEEFVRAFAELQQNITGRGNNAGLAK